MAYSLVGAPFLGFDLVRLPCGPDVAHVLLAGLRSGPAELHRLAEAHPGILRRPRWQQVMACVPVTTVRDTLHLAGDALDLAAAGQASASTAVLRRLELAPLGDLAALDRLIRSDVLGWTWRSSDGVAVQDETASRAADVLLDAATAAYCSQTLPASLRRDLAEPFRRSGAGQAPAPEQHAVVAALARTTAAERQTWRSVVDELRPETSRWAPAMHQASWAVHLSERVKTAAAAQLEAVGAFRHGGFTPRDAAYGVWNAISGVLQATVVEDLLAIQDHALLVRPWVLARGVQPGTGSA